MLDVIGQDDVRSARPKGLPDRLTVGKATPQEGGPSNDDQT